MPRALAGCARGRDGACVGGRRPGARARARHSGPGARRCVESLGESVPMKAIGRLPSARETENLGVPLARNWPWDEREPRLIFLSGELGAGKSTMAAALLQ